MALVFVPFLELPLSDLMVVSHHLFVEVDPVSAHVMMVGAEMHNESELLRPLPVSRSEYMMPMGLTIPTTVMASPFFVTRYDAFQNLDPLEMLKFAVYLPFLFLCLKIPHGIDKN